MAKVYEYFRIKNERDAKMDEISKKLKKISMLDSKKDAERVAILYEKIGVLQAEVNELNNKMNTLLDMGKSIDL